MSHELIYPVILDRGDEGDVTVTFPDLPEAATFGWSEAEALASASDALRVSLAMRINDDRPIPPPSPAGKGQHSVAAPAEIAAKIAVYDAFRRAGITKVQLAQRLHVKENEVRRILDPKHRTKLDRLEEAARALGGRLQVEWRPL